eukprot:184229_1
MTHNWCTICLIVICSASDILMEANEEQNAPLTELKEEIKLLTQKIDKLELMIGSIDPECILIEGDKSKYFVSSETECINKWGQYEIEAQVNANKIGIYLHDTKTKRIYWNEFDSKQLQHCGFSDNQVSNLELLSQFILHCVNEPSDNEQFSVSGNQTVTFIEITIKNKIFRDIKIVMEVYALPRKKSDILQEHFIDLQSEYKIINENNQKLLNENLSLKQRLLNLELTCNKNAYGQFLRFNVFEATEEFTKLSLEKVIYNKNIELNNGGFKFSFDGIYRLTIGYRGGNNCDDIWTNFWVKNSNNKVVGSSNKFGNAHLNSPQQHTVTFLINVDSVDDVYFIEMGRVSGHTRTNKLKILQTSWNTDNDNIQNSNANIVVVINFVG